ncbi:DUF2167 domain-containing protein [Pseudomonas sp. 2FE]|uniref:DUF2167 domain-containing protein n=1 Tax=Pseudomonas sp. 2FE TaxID=2502190 RepID=UPI0010F7D160|nr:DUF2167 domain-containing protein [Pseudomonas sp. 2FE]
MSIKELILAGLLAAAIPYALASQAAEETAAQVQDEVASELAAESATEQDPAVTDEQFVAGLHPQTGKVVIGANLATLDLPEQFVFLNSADAERVLTEAWGNPPSDPLPLGMILPAGISPLAGGSWAVTIEYEENGYVSDEDAADIDYDEMLKGMQEDSLANNKWRSEQGYEPVALIGWAAKPHYDAEGKKLYWAKELKFGEAETNTLNYNIRVLGRKGVLVLNFVADMQQLAAIEQNLPGVLAMTEFNDGNRYADFNPELDKVAAYGLGALIAGKVAAKVGLLAAGLLLLKKFWFIVIGGGIWLFNRLRGKQAKPLPVAEPLASQEPPAPPIAPATTVLDLNHDEKPPQS